MRDFVFERLYRLAEDNASYRRLEEANLLRLGGRDFLEIAPGALRLLAAEAFHDIAFFHRARHLEQLAAVISDPEASANDRFTAEALLKNAIVSAQGVLPMCQDTGTATVIGWKSEGVLTGTDDERELSAGVYDAYVGNHLRYSQVLARSMFEDRNSGTNLPAQIDIMSTPVPAGGPEYGFLFIAKGGGSANKTFLFQPAPDFLRPEALRAFMREKTAALGTAACPPYHLVMVIGGLSAEMNLKTLKLATAGYLDGIPAQADGSGAAFRDPEWEAELLQAARGSGLGAQFGGRHLALDARVLRLPRHAASCPVSIGVSCSADRNVRARINAGGVFLEELERRPERFLPALRAGEFGGAPRIDLDRSMDEIRRALSGVGLGKPVLLNGPLVVARDQVHAVLHAALRAGGPLPDWFRSHPVYYAGPAKTPPGYASGSLGPTTAQRMDAYIEEFMAAGASLVTLAKGNRGPELAEACRRYGGFYLGTIGGAAALLAAENITASRILDHAELGMEAVRLIEVKDLPAFVLCDDTGGDYYRLLGQSLEGRREK